MTDKNVKGHFCWLCGSLENITAHHLKTANTRTKKVREELGIILYNGEVIPLCRDCHDKIEEIKRIRNLSKSFKATYKSGYEKGFKDGSSCTGSRNNSQEEKARTRNGDKTSMKLSKTPENSLAINGVGTPDKYSQTTRGKNNG